MMKRATVGFCIIALFTVTVGSCVPVPSAGISGIAIREPWSRQAMGGNNGAAFMFIANTTTQDDRLVSAEATVAQRVELHETVEQDGVMSMIPQPDGFLLPAGATLELKPGGKHVMLMGLLDPLEPGQMYRLTLNFEHAGPLTIEVPVREP